MNAQRQRVLFLSHGGGPLPLLGDPGHRQMIDTLQAIAGELPRRSAIVLISAHWEAPLATVGGAARPPLIHDYYGFPDAAYQIEYPAPGQPQLAQSLLQVLEGQGIEAALDEQRGFDHGMFVPLKLMYPQADIPCVQLSLLDSLDAAAHIRLGRALRQLDQDGLLIIGSGFSFHNMRAFFSKPTAQSRADNAAFEQWLVETCSSAELDEAQREQRLLDWEQAPAARYCHPREEHLLPLHVCYGAAAGPAQRVWRIEVLGRQASLYLW